MRYKTIDIQLSVRSSKIFARPDPPSIGNWLMRLRSETDLECWTQPSLRDSFPTALRFLRGLYGKPLSPAIQSAPLRGVGSQAATLSRVHTAGAPWIVRRNPDYSFCTAGRLSRLNLATSSKKAAESASRSRKETSALE